jgi:hypothetical protein
MLTVGRDPTMKGNYEWLDESVSMVALSTFCDAHIVKNGLNEAAGRSIACSLLRTLVS